MNPSAQQLIQSRSAECVVAEIRAPCEITYGEPTDNSAVRFDFDLSQAIARFTWWSDSSYLSETLTVDGRQLANAHGYASDALVASAIIKDLVAFAEQENAT